MIKRLIQRNPHPLPHLQNPHIKICINSPITRWRNMAAKALIGWQDELGKHLPQIDEELAELVVSVHAKECVEDTRKMWSKLL